jgi:hypothetical protein
MTVMVGLRSEDGRRWWDGRQWRVIQAAPPTPRRSGLQHAWQAVLLAVGVAAMALFGGAIGSGLDQAQGWLQAFHDWLP